MFSIGELARGLVRLAAAIERMSDEYKRSNEINVDVLVDSRRQTAALETVANQNADIVRIRGAELKNREDWQIIEREHMKVCERRYRTLVEGESMEVVPEQRKPVRH